jgi:hypothetical protein
LWLTKETLKTRFKQIEIWITTYPIEVLSLAATQRMEEQRPWHRLFGLTWSDFFTGQPVTVEMEKDLSLNKQLLDVLLIHKEGEILNCRLPDGFEDFARFNLVTFKSYADKLSVWTLCTRRTCWLCPFALW